MKFLGLENFLNTQPPEAEKWSKLLGIDIQMSKFKKFYRVPQKESD
jgi:hypothetical protein